MQITKASGALRLDALADRLHHLQIDAEQIVAAHARLAGDAGGDDDHVGAGDVGIVVRALELRVEALDRAALGEVERLALRHALDDVEQDDVAKLLRCREMGERAADIAGADQRDLVASHGALQPFLGPKRRRRRTRPGARLDRSRARGNHGWSLRPRRRKPETSPSRTDGERGPPKRSGSGRGWCRGAPHSRPCGRGRRAHNNDRHRLARAKLDVAAAAGPVAARGVAGGEGGSRIDAAPSRSVPADRRRPAHPGGRAAASRATSARLTNSTATRSVGAAR